MCLYPQFSHFLNKGPHFPFVLDSVWSGAASGEGGPVGKRPRVTRRGSRGEKLDRSVMLARFARPLNVDKRGRKGHLAQK